MTWHKDTAFKAHYEIKLVLFSLKFRSVKITLLDEDSTVIFFSPDSTFNLNKNPFNDPSLWQTDWIDWSMPDNDCPNPIRIKNGVLYLKTDYIESLYQEN